MTDGYDDDITDPDHHLAGGFDDDDHERDHDRDVDDHGLDDDELVGRHEGQQGDDRGADPGDGVEAGEPVEARFSFESFDPPDGWVDDGADDFLDELFARPGWIDADLLESAPVAGDDVDAGFGADEPDATDIDRVAREMWGRARPGEADPAGATTALVLTEVAEQSPVEVDRQAARILLRMLTTSGEAEGRS